MINTKQKTSIQSMNNDKLSLWANNEGKCNTPGCRRINYNELYGKSIQFENEMQHVGSTGNSSSAQAVSLHDLSLSSKEGMYHLTQRMRYMWLPNTMDALWYVFDAMGFLACITWTEKARQHR